MPEQHITSLITRLHQPLIGVQVDTNGHEEVIYFVDEAEADEALNHDTTRAPVKLAGVWSDLDADEMLAALNTIRHESKPTPPIDKI